MKKKSLRISCAWNNRETKTRGVVRATFLDCGVGQPSSKLLFEREAVSETREDAIRAAKRIGRLSIFMAEAGVSMIGGHRVTELHDKTVVGGVRQLNLPEADHTISWRIKGTHGLNGTFLTTEPYDEDRAISKLAAWCESRPAGIRVWKNQGFWNPPYTWLALILPLGFQWPTQVMEGLNKAMDCQVVVDDAPLTGPIRRGDSLR